MMNKHQITLVKNHPQVKRMRTHEIDKNMVFRKQAMLKGKNGNISKIIRHCSARDSSPDLLFSHDETNSSNFKLITLSSHL